MSLHQESPFRTPDLLVRLAAALDHVGNHRRNPTRTPPDRIQKTLVHLESLHVLAARGVSMRMLWSVDYEYVL